MPITDDTVIEATENFTVVLSNIVSNLGVGFVDGATSNTANGTTLDDDANDPGNGIAFTDIDVIVTEGDPGDTVNVTFTVNFTGTIAPGETVTVDYVTVDSTAADTTDFEAQPGTLTFDENTSSIDIIVPIVNDFVIEETEGFTVLLSNIQSNIGVGFVDGATENNANGTILDNDLREILVEPYTEEITILCGDEIPAVPELVFFNGCGDYTFDFTDERQDATDGSDDYLLIRTWVVTDACLNTATFEQIIFVFQPQLEEVTIDICIEDEAIDLINFLPESFDTNGTFEVLEGDVVLNGSLFDPLDHLPGEYKIAYSSTEGDCKYFVDFTIVVNTDCVPCGRGEIEISEAVTANGDGVNDTFEIRGVEFCQFTFDVQIFNRWGDKVYESRDYRNDWSGASPSGSLGGSGELPSGTYYYIIKATDNDLGIDVKPFNGYIYLGTN